MRGASGFWLAQPVRVGCPCVFHTVHTPRLLFLFQLKHLGACAPPDKQLFTMHLSTCSVSRASIRGCCSRQRCTAGPALVPRLHGRAATPLVVVRATPSSSSGDAQQPSGLSVEEAAKVLGCSSTASFDDILARKNALLDAAGPDKARCEEVEQAYDLLLSASLRRRLSGGASPSVRFADVSSPRKAASKGAQVGAGRWR